MMEKSTLNHAVKIGLHFYGIRPYLSTTILFRLYWITALSTAQIFQYRYVIVNIDTDNFSEYMDGVSSAMASSLLFIKLAILWGNQKTFHEILQMMAADWQDYISNFGSHLMTSNAHLAHRSSRSIIGLQVVAVFFYTYGVLAANAGDPDRWEPYARELILKMDFPFNISTNSIYIGITVVQFVHLMLVACGITVINSLLVTLILHDCGQIDMLCEWLTKLFSRDASLSTNETTSQSTGKITMRSIIAKHQRIIKFSDNVEDVYTYIALMILLSDTLITCCLGFIIVTSIGTPNGGAILVKSVLFYITMNFEVFIYCFAGEYLSAKSKKIGNAAYDSLWYNTSIKNSRTILFVILRAQKRLTITSGKIVDLSLERFTSVVKASASYISVLLAMY
ncbi:odorant receptor 4-like [Odontomachus brunneus]|uniref:odorant receptor 4-like n=1 Tax=Odontomachus brunneus TaxID=486640 RepID=UPI0013F19420|nr:odorant receptor 4-like [Odontomachus brunneus]